VRRGGRSGANKADEQCKESGGPEAETILLVMPVSERNDMHDGPFLRATRRETRDDQAGRDGKIMGFGQSAGGVALKSRCTHNGFMLGYVAPVIDRTTGSRASRCEPPVAVAVRRSGSHGRLLRPTRENAFTRVRMLTILSANPTPNAWTALRQTRSNSSSPARGGRFCHRNISHHTTTPTHHHTTTQPHNHTTTQPHSYPTYKHVKH
jgi:hypothetical protein